MPWGLGHGADPTASGFEYYSDDEHVLYCCNQYGDADDEGGRDIMTTTMMMIAIIAMRLFIATPVITVCTVISMFRCLIHLSRAGSNGVGGGGSQSFGLCDMPSCVVKSFGIPRRSTFDVVPDSIASYIFTSTHTSM